MGDDSVDGEDGLVGSQRLGLLLPNRRRRGRRFSPDRRYWPFSCWLIFMVGRG